MLRLFRGGNKHTKTIWWFLIILTVVTFVGGFVFLFGLGADQGRSAATSGTVGTINGERISSAEYDQALTNQRDAYQRQYGSEPTDRDLRMVEAQAWRTLVVQRLMGKLAKEMGIKVYDAEVVLSLKTSVPPEIAASPAFQTNGKFDEEKYAAAIRNPGSTNINWPLVERLVREQLPTRKVEQRLLSSIKLSQPELEQAYRDRFERVDATIVAVPPSNDPKLPPATPAELDKTYETYKNRFVSGDMVQLELAIVPRKYTDEDVRTARQLAQSLVDRARKGEDFQQLAKDYSEGPAAEKGGVIDRILHSGDFGVMGQHIETLPIGGVSDPFQDGSRFLIFKVLEKPVDPQTHQPGFKVAQIVVRVRPNDTTVQDQLTMLDRLRDRATRAGLGPAAAEKGIATAKTRYFNADNPPEELFSAPEVADWAMQAKPGALSPVFPGLDEYVIARVAAKHEAGPMSKQEVGDQLRQLAEIDKRVQAMKPKADSIAAALASGRTLEQAAASVGLTARVASGINRSQPDPQVGNSPELMGALFASQPGKVIGPIRGVTGWYFARVNQKVAADTSSFDKLKGQVSTEILSARQRSFFAGFVDRLRANAKVQDLRGATRSMD